MADLTSEEIFELTRQEFRRILEEDQRNRMRFPGKYEFGALLPSEGPIPGDWQNISEMSPWEYNDSSQAERILREKLRTNGWPDLRLPVLVMLKRCGIDIAEDDPVINEVCHVYTQAFIEAVAAVRQREYGFTDYVPEVFLKDAPITHASQQLPKQPVPDKPKRNLSDLVREYSDEKKQHGWAERSERTIMERLGYLVELMGDVDLSAVDNDFAFEFRKKLLVKPKKKQSKEAIKSGKLENIAPGTVNNIITDIAAMFKYAKRRGWVAENYFAEMTIQDKTPAHKKRQPFTKDELTLLFGSGFAKACKGIPWRFWIPVLGLFTGGRLDEIAQARVDDVREIDGIWCLCVESSDEKSVKTISGNRSIPLHQFLIQDLKFLAFVEDMRNKGEVELFPGLKRVQGRKGHYVTKWFGDYRDSLGIPKTRTFHSLRKNFSKCLAINNVPANMIKRLDGHSLKNDVTEHHYIQDIPVTKLAEYICKLDYGFDLSHLASRFAERNNK